MLNHCGTRILESDRLILRPFRYVDDEDMLTYWISDPAIQSMYSEPVYTTKEEVKELLDKYMGSYERSDYYRWAIIEKLSGICIGQIAIFLVDNKNHFCEIEYCLGNLFHRKGYMTEAVRAILEFCFIRYTFTKFRYATKRGIFLHRGLLKNVTLPTKVLYGIFSLWTAVM
ncbi:MAG: GNAT family N-acetyltransferase [Tannerellaceae bacterium]|nr:GNAT family N-acetyltransferase [Tannerellaceae bacterium]